MSSASNERRPLRGLNVMSHKFACPLRPAARLLTGAATAFLIMAPLRVPAEDAAGAKVPQKVLRFVPAATPAAGLPDAASGIKSVATPPNRIVVELDSAGTTDGTLEISSGQPLCLGAASGCLAALRQAADSIWNVAVTGRQAGARQVVELANCRSPEDAVTPSLFKRNRHEEFMRRKSAGALGLLFLGDSITDWWPKNGKDTWAKFAPHNPANFGIAAMRTEGLLWNITNGELDGIKPKAVVILIGVNNLLQCPDEKPEWVAAGVRKVVDTVREKLPESKILLLAVFPARNPGDHPVRARLAEVNRLLPAIADGEDVQFLDIGKLFLAPDGTIRKDLMPDGVHPNAKGYQVWFDAMNPVLSKMME